MGLLRELDSLSRPRLSLAYDSCFPEGSAGAEEAAEDAVARRAVVVRAVVAALVVRGGPRTEAGLAGDRGDDHLQLAGVQPDAATSRALVDGHATVVDLVERRVVVHAVTLGFDTPHCATPPW